MNTKRILCAALGAVCYFAFLQAQVRTEQTFEKGWKFTREDNAEFANSGYNDSKWQNVTVPHDWAIYGPFSINNDKQEMAITQDGQTEAMEHAGRTGGLPFVGTGWYRLNFDAPGFEKGKKATLIFDGAMSHARVYVNGQEAGYWPYGYNSFYVDATPYLKPGERNELAVRLENEPESSRWYPGAGLYRNVHLVINEDTHIPAWGTYATTPVVTDKYAKVSLKTSLVSPEGANKDNYRIVTQIKDKNGKVVATGENKLSVFDNALFEQEFAVANPELWSPDTPVLYTAESKVYEGNTLKDEYTTRFGIRTLEIVPGKGFFLNGKETKFKGVCVHHDGGCLGAAMYREVWLRRLLKLKEGGCNAIRCSHNPHMPELYDLCDELGLLMMDEAFDEWENPKNKWSTGHNVYPPKHEGYAEDFPEWHERDLADMVRRDRNHPSIVMWSIGNEIDYPNDPYCHPLFETMTGNNDANKPAKERQYDPNKPNAERLSVIAKELAAIVRTQDTTRPVTLAAAFPELSSHIGFFDALDVVGYNYKEHLYEESHKRFPDKPFLGSENGGGYEQWCAVRDNAYISGQFLWTGIDYLGEAHGWPIHGSSAGLMDLAGFEKPGFYRRKAFWSTEPFACILTRPDDGDEHEWRPWNAHWNYTDGENVVVRVFTNVQKETISLSIVGNDGEKSLHDGTYLEKEGCTEWRFAYEPGVLKAVCGEAECSIQTARKSSRAVCKCMACRRNYK